MSPTSLSGDRIGDPESVSRRRFLKLGVAVAGGVVGGSIAGCVGVGEVGRPELVWGRRGWADGRFIKPRAIAIDPEDRLYIVDTTGRIQVFDADGSFLRVWSTPETANGRPTGLSIRAADRRSPEPLLLVADTHYYRMLVYTLDGTLRPELQIGGVAGFGPGEFAFVTEAVCDAEGCYYIGEYGDSDRIQKFDPDGRFMTTWGGTGSEPGRFVRPQSLAIDPDTHTLYVADSCNHRIVMFDLTATTPELIGTIGRSGGGPGQLHYPYDLALTAGSGRSRQLIVCEYGNQRLQRFDRDGTSIATWGSPGHSPGRLYQPWGVVVDSVGRVHVLDSNNHRVQRIAATWIG